MNKKDGLTWYCLLNILLSAERIECKLPDTIRRLCVFAHRKPIKLTAEQKRYLLAIVNTEGMRTEAWRLYGRLYKSSYPYGFFLKRLYALQKKGLIKVEKSGKRGGRVVELLLQEPVL